MLVDYSTEVAEKIPAAEKLAQEDHLQAIDSLMLLEKNCRMNHDAVSLSKILVCVAEICYKQKAWNDLNDNIMALTKRRSLIKMAVTKMVQRCCEFVEEMEKIPSLAEPRVALIDCLRTATNGKIYVEVERARLTLKLAMMKEAQGKINEAANTLNELQVETYGSMDRKEKVGFILEQMRLTIDDNDFERAQIICKKISTRYFAETEEEVQKLKLKYYKLMIQLGMKDKKYLEVSKHFIQVYETPIVVKEPKHAEEALISAAIFSILAEISPEQQTQLNSVKSMKALDDLPIHKNFLNLFLTSELMKWSDINQEYTKELRNSQVVDIFSNSEDGETRWKDLQYRIIEHNIRVIAKCFTRIRTQRMAEHLDLSLEQTEKHLSDMVVKGAVWARVDRLSGIVNFERKKLPSERLNDWSNTIDTLMDLLNKATHCIQKEEMVHALKA